VATTLASPTVGLCFGWRNYASRMVENNSSTPLTRKIDLDLRTRSAPLDKEPRRECNFGPRLKVAPCSMVSSQLHRSLVRINDRSFALGTRPRPPCHHRTSWRGRRRCPASQTSAECTTSTSCRPFCSTPAAPRSRSHNTPLGAWRSRSRTRRRRRASARPQWWRSHAPDATR